MTYWGGHINDHFLGITTTHQTVILIIEKGSLDSCRPIQLSIDYMLTAAAHMHLRNVIKVQRKTITLQFQQHLFLALN